MSIKGPKATNDGRRSKTLLPYAALVLSLVLFLGSGIIQVNAWNLNHRIDTLDDRMTSIGDTVAGLVKIADSNTRAIGVLTALHMRRTGQ